LRQIEIAGFADRLADVERLEHGKFARPLGECAGDPEDVLCAFAGAQLAPILFVSAACRADGAIDIGGVSRRDFGQGLFGGRIDRRETLPRTRGR
jgi:hypothetical protein